METEMEEQERVFAYVTCGVCHKRRQCEWLDDSLLKAAGCKVTDGFFVCYQCYDIKDKDRPYLPKVEYALR